MIMLKKQLKFLLILSVLDDICKNIHIFRNDSIIIIITCYYLFLKIFFLHSKTNHTFYIHDEIYTIKYGNENHLERRKNWLN